MKPNIKSSIPLTIIRFIAGIALLMIVVVGLDGLPIYKTADRYNIWESYTHISADGRVTYVAARGMSTVDSIMDLWYFDETLENPQKGNLNSYNTSDSIAHNNVENIERNSRLVRFFQSSLDSRNMVNANIPIIWWNGPAGQLDWYDGVSRMRVASLGPAGPAVQAPARPEERFEITNSYLFTSREYLATVQGIYDISRLTTSFRVKPVYTGLYKAFTRLYITPDRESRLLIVHGNILSILDEQGSLLREMSLPEIAVSLFRERSRVAMFENGSVSIDGFRELWDEKTICLLAQDGSLLRRVDYNTEEIEKAMNGGVDQISLLPFPTLLPPWPIPGLMEKSALIQSVILSLILAAAVLWHQMRIGRRGAWRAVWTAFTFVFGLLGFATYLVAYRDRLCESCPDCRRLRLITEETCTHCGASWSKPKPLGIEICR